jgi:catalase
LFNRSFTFELGKVDVPAVVNRMLTRLMLVDAELARRVGVGPGIPVEAGRKRARDADASPALAMITNETFLVDGRVVHILGNDRADFAGNTALKEPSSRLGRRLTSLQPTRVRSRERRRAQ